MELLFYLLLSVTIERVHQHYNDECTLLVPLDNILAATNARKVLLKPKEVSFRLTMEGGLLPRNKL
jgi:hypothetical protein